MGVGFASEYCSDTSALALQLGKIERIPFLGIQKFRCECCSKIRLACPGGMIEGGRRTTAEILELKGTLHRLGGGDHGLSRSLRFSPCPL